MLINLNNKICLIQVLAQRPSQSDDGPDGDDLRPIDDNDGHSGDRGEIRSFSQYGGEYEVGTTSGYFGDRSKFDEN
ncbi:hypothetical protein Gotur_005794, partial [Gossypium turneri]